MKSFVGEFEQKIHKSKPQIEVPPELRRKMNEKEERKETSDIRKRTREGSK